MMTRKGMKNESVFQVLENQKLGENSDGAECRFLKLIVWFVARRQRGARLRGFPRQVEDTGDWSDADGKGSRLPWKRETERAGIPQRRMPFG